MFVIFKDECDSVSDGARARFVRPPRSLKALMRVTHARACVRVCAARGCAFTRVRERTFCDQRARICSAARGLAARAACLRRVPCGNGTERVRAPPPVERPLLADSGRACVDMMAFVASMAVVGRRFRSLFVFHKSFLICTRT